MRAGSRGRSASATKPSSVPPAGEKPNADASVARSDVAYSTTKSPEGANGERDIPRWGPRDSPSLSFGARSYPRARTSTLASAPSTCTSKLASSMAAGPPRVASG
jgi:hypothetical protein